MFAHTHTRAYTYKYLLLFIYLYMRLNVFFLSKESLFSPYYISPLNLKSKDIDHLKIIQWG